MKTNVAVQSKREYTHEGGRAAIINAEQQLRRSLMACLLWEKGFYEDGVEIGLRIASLIPEVKPEKVAAMAIEARTKMKLRHAPLWVVRNMAKHPKHKAYVAGTLTHVIQRADELAEFVSLYWLEGKQPLSAQVKKGLAEAFTKFDAYQLAKYNRDNGVKLRDVLFLCHAKPKDEEQAAIWKKLVDGTLESPDTWEVALSTGKAPKETWERLISEKKLGGMALLRNLRNMREAGVDENLIFGALAEMRTERILPYRFIAAARYAPQWESKIEPVMLKCMEGREKLPGKTVLLIDVSGSMQQQLSGKSDLLAEDAASGLAILARELCDQVAVYTFSSKLVRVPDRHGFALRDAIDRSQQHASTELRSALEGIEKAEDYDRIIVITDEQSSDGILKNPKGKGYLINVATNKNGVGYGKWVHLDGFSEAVFDYILELEAHED